MLYCIIFLIFIIGSEDEEHLSHVLARKNRKCNFLWENRQIVVCNFIYFNNKYQSLTSSFKFHVLNLEIHTDLSVDRECGQNTFPGADFMKGLRLSPVSG